MTITCPVCQHEFELDPDEAREAMETHVECEECGAELKVVSRRPLRVQALDHEGVGWAGRDEEDE